MNIWRGRREGNKPQKILNDKAQTEGWWMGVSEEWAKWLTGTKEGTCCDEYWVLYVSDESLNSTPETTALYVGQLKFK